MKRTLAGIVSLALSCTPKLKPTIPLTVVDIEKSDYSVRELSSRNVARKKLTVEEMAESVIESLRKIKSSKEELDGQNFVLISRDNFSYGLNLGVECSSSFDSSEKKLDVLHYTFIQNDPGFYSRLEIADFKPFGKADYFSMVIFDRTNPTKWIDSFFIEENKDLDKLYVDMIQHSYKEIKAAKKNKNWMDRLPWNDDHKEADIKINIPYIKNSYSKFLKNLDTNKGISRSDLNLSKKLPYDCSWL